jgi:hypothetical protein
MEMAIFGVGKAVWAIIADNRLAPAIGGIVTILASVAKRILPSKKRRTIDSSSPEGKLTVTRKYEKPLR